MKENLYFNKFDLGYLNIWYFIGFLKFNQLNLSNLWGFGVLGTPLAPVLANLYLAILEKKLKSQISDTKSPISWPLFFKRYIDDILIISNQSRMEIETFLSLLNNMVPSLKFKLESGGPSANFLDLKIFKGKRFILLEYWIWKSTKNH